MTLFISVQCIIKQLLDSAFVIFRIIEVRVIITVTSTSIIAILTVTSPIDINVPTRGLLAVETKDSFVLWLAKFK